MAELKKEVHRVLDDLHRKERNDFLKTATKISSPVWIGLILHVLTGLALCSFVGWFIFGLYFIPRMLKNE